MSHPIESSGVAPVTVVLPTIGRAELLRNCLESLSRCNPRADEILIIDSSKDDAVERVVERFGSAGARAIRCSTPGLGSAFNVGLAKARHEIVLLTNDDCTVDPFWIERGLDHVSARESVIVTGRVRPDGDPRVVPSTIDDPLRREHSGRPDFVLYTQCMAVRAPEVLAIGGFDGQIRPSAEDNDLSYRWLQTGRRICYEPDFVVWHHDWRTEKQLERLYVGYGVGQGMVYAKHLCRGDLRIARFLVRDLYRGARGFAARIARGRPEQPDPRRGLPRGLLAGLATGLRTFWRVRGRERRSG
jgi:GT2 family glycosyltransferase